MLVLKAIDLLRLNLLHFKKGHILWSWSLNREILQVGGASLGSLNLLNRCQCGFGAYSTYLGEDLPFIGLISETAILLFPWCYPSVYIQSSPTLWPHGLQPMRLFVYGIFQARILEWVAISYFRGFSQPRYWTRLLHWQGSSLPLHQSLSLK